MSLVTSELSFSGAAVGRLGLDEVTGSDLYQHSGALSSVSQSEKPNKFLTSLIGCEQKTRVYIFVGDQYDK